MQKSIPWIFAAAALAAGVFLGGCGHQQAPVQMMPEVEVISVAPKQVVLTTELPGRTAAYRIAEIRPQVNGLIQKRLFTEGADVKAGDVLYQIDPAPYQAALNNAKASLARSQASLPAVRARAERFKDLLPSKAVSQQDCDDAAAALNQLEADIKSWQAMLETARINLAYTRITAPISGRIGRSSVTEGAIVTAYQPIALATIQQLDPIYVDVQQSTADLLSLRRRLESGRLVSNGRNLQKVNLVVTDGTAYPLEGNFQFRDVTVDPRTGSVTLRVVFPNPDGELLPGMFVRARIKEGVNEHDILVPQQAVSRDHKGDPYVYVVGQDDQLQVRPVTLDRALGDQWLVTRGLAPGDRVVVVGQMKVRPGMKVKVLPYQAKPESGAQNAPQSN